MTHLPLMYQWLKPGGKMVSVANACFLNHLHFMNPQYANQRSREGLYHRFLHWLDAVKAKVIKLPQGSFATASRTTDVETVLIVAKKN